MSRQNKEEASDFVDTKVGIFTASGNWYHTTESELVEFAGPLLEKTPLRDLLDRADTWIRAPQTLTVCTFPVLLLVLPTVAALLAALGVFVVLKLTSPALASYRPAGVLKVLESVPLQFVLYLGVLSWLAAWPDYAAVVAGLSVFIILRWKLLDGLVGPLVESVHRSWYRLPAADQTFRTIVLKAALVHRVSLPQFREIERRIQSKIKP